MPLVRSLIVFVVLAIAFAAAAAGQSFVSGRVTTIQGVQLGGKVVSAYTIEGSGDPITTVTNPDGTYTLSLPSAGTWRLLAWDSTGIYATSFYRDASSFETSAQITVGPGATVRDVDFRLHEAVTVLGTVAGPSGLAAGMTVSAYNLDGTRRGFQTTDASGGFSLTLPPGTYKFAAWDENGALAPEFYREKVRFDNAETVTLSSNLSGVHFTLERGATVSGRVTAESTDQPLGAVKVVAYDGEGNEVRHTFTGGLGTWSMVLPASPNPYRFAALTEDGSFEIEYSRNAPTFESAASYVLSAGQNLGGIDFTLIEASQSAAVAVLYLPAASNVPGGFDSLWQTDLWIYNPGDEALETQIEFLAAGEANEEPAAATMTVPARGQLEIRNVVQSLFGRTANGALRITTDQTVLATSRTFNTPPGGAEEGTFGFSMPGFDLSASAGRSVLAGLSNGPVFRANIGVLNPHEHPIELRYRLYSPSGALLGEATRQIDAYEWTQTNIGQVQGLPVEFDEAYLVLSSTDGSFFSYAALVDNRSNDPSLILPERDPASD